MSTEVKIGNVARVTRTHVGDEANALKADAMLAELLPGLQELDGYVKTSRTVCKAEWAYEVAIVFKDLDSFKGYMGSDFREKTAVPQWEKMLALSAEPDKAYAGNRVYDDL